MTHLRQRLHVLLLAAIAAGTASAAVSDADRMKVLELNAHLESQPLAADGKETRGWLTQFGVESPDVSVSLCDTLGILGDKAYPYAGELGLQPMYGMIAWQVEHPQDKDLDPDVQVAGVRSALKAYASILAQYPKATHPHMDELAAHEAAGDLREHMEGVIAAKCKS